jgi:predicted phage gp36 major capsid-like protein
MFTKASNLKSDGTVYSSDNMREALELCEKQERMIEEMREELDKLQEEISEEDE